MRTIEFTCTQSGIAPFSPQYAGVQGEDCSTQAVFTIDSAVDIEPEQGHSVVARVDCTDGAGAFYASEHLEIDSNRNATFVIPHDITRAGGMCRVNLVLSELDADNVEQRIIYSGTATLYFENSAQGTPPRNQYKRELSGLMGAAAAAAESAQDSANKLSQHNNDSEAHQPLKDYSDGNLIAHNTNSEAHADIRAEIEDMHAVNRIRLDAPLSVGVSGHYVRVLHRPPAGQGDETLRFSLNGAIPADAEKFVIWMKADQALASGVVQLKLRKTADASPAEGDETYFFAVGKMWDRLEIDLTALADKTVYRSMMLVINGAAGVNIYFDQISYIMEDGSTRMLYSFDDLTPTNYAPPQYAYGADGCNFYGVQAIGCVNVGTIDQSAGWMWHGEIEVMDKEDPAPVTGKYLTVKASYYCGDNSSLVTAEKTFLSTDCDFGLQYINLSHDPDAEELASVTSTRDPAGWTSIAVIQILNDMWQLPSVIWLDDVLYHDQSETAHADIRKELEAVGDDISAQIATHNSSNENVHPYILQSIPAQISGHNASAAAHADIREELAAVGDDLGAQMEAHNASAAAHADIREEIVQAAQRYTVSGTNTLKLTDTVDTQQGFAIRLESKNLAPYPYLAASDTKNGLTFTENNGVITINGTATEQTAFWLNTGGGAADIYTKPDTYTLSGCPDGGGQNTYFIQWVTQDGDSGQVWMNLVDYGSGATGTLRFAGLSKIAIVIRAGTVCDNLVFKPQLERGTVRSAYVQPLSNFPEATIKMTDEHGNSKTLTPAADGSVTVEFPYLFSMAPPVTLTCAVADRVVMYATYIRDLNIVCDSIIDAMAAGESWENIQRVVRLGFGSKYFPVGYEFTTADSETGATIVWAVRGHDHHTPANGALAHSMTLEAKYVYGNSDGVYKGVVFDAPEALYYAASGLAAGTYHFALPADYDTANGGGKTYQFTLANAVPAGGVIVFPWEPGTQAASVQISSYASNAATDAIESVPVTEGSGGTSLGTADGTADHMNHIHRVRYGSGNYAQSAVRQWLNSNKSAGSVWAPQTIFDRPSSRNATYNGFMRSLPADFLAAVQPAMIDCRTNSVYECNSLDGTAFAVNQTYTLKDQFFPLSRPEIYGTWDSESYKDGEQLAYYKGLTNTERIKYDAGGTARYCWTRSPVAGDASYARYVYAGGAVGGTGVYNAHGIAPACIIA